MENDAIKRIALKSPVKTYNNSQKLSIFTFGTKYESNHKKENFNFTSNIIDFTPKKKITNLFQFKEEERVVLLSYKVRSLDQFPMKADIFSVNFMSEAHLK